MSFAEAVEYVQGAELKKRDGWEQTRFLMYAICQVNSKKKIDPQDILELPWDDLREENTEEEIKALRERVKNFKID